MSRLCLAKAPGAAEVMAWSLGRPGEAGGRRGATGGREMTQEVAAAAQGRGEGLDGSGTGDRGGVPA